MTKQFRNTIVKFRKKNKIIAEQRQEFEETIQRHTEQIQEQDKMIATQKKQVEKQSMIIDKHVSSLSSTGVIKKTPGSNEEEFSLPSINKPNGILK